MTSKIKRRLEEIRDKDFDREDALIDLVNELAGALDKFPIYGTSDYQKNYIIETLCDEPSRDRATDEKG